MYELKIYKNGLVVATYQISKYNTLYLRAVKANYENNGCIVTVKTI